MTRGRRQHRLQAEPGTRTVWNSYLLVLIFVLAAILAILARMVSFTTHRFPHRIAGPAPASITMVR